MAVVVRISIPLHSEMNCGTRRKKICQITSNILPHYITKFECSATQLCSPILARIIGLHATHDNIDELLVDASV